MRKCLIAGVALLSFVGSGCPHDWMEGGTNDRAMRKDTQEELEELRQASQPCPEGQRRKEQCKEGADGQMRCKWICQ